MPSTPSSTPSERPPAGPDTSTAPTRRARWILAGIAVVVVLAIGVVTWVVVAGSDGGGSSSAEVVPTDVRAGGPQVGDPAPDFTLPTLDGTHVSLSDYAGTPVVLNFWASWCTPCRKEFPLLRKQLARHGGEFVVLGVDNRDIDSDARSFVEHERATWTNAIDSANGVWRAYGAQQLPQTFFVARDGTVAARLYGELMPDTFATALDKITR